MGIGETHGAKGMPYCGPNGWAKRVGFQGVPGARAAHSPAIPLPRMTSPSSGRWRGSGIGMTHATEIVSYVPCGCYVESDQGGCWAWGKDCDCKKRRMVLWGTVSGVGGIPLLWGGGRKCLGIFLLCGLGLGLLGTSLSVEGRMDQDA